MRLTVMVKMKVKSLMKMSIQINNNKTKMITDTCELHKNSHNFFYKNI